MDVISFSEAATANSRIEIINANPDSNSGVLTQPKVIEAGETVTIKSGRQAILADTVVDGDLVVEAGGEVFVPAGANFSDLNGQIALKADTSYVNGKYSGFKNYIINGKKVVNQRNLTTANNSYNQDRWYKANNNWFQGIEGANNLTSGKTYTLSWVGSATASYYIGNATSLTINSQTFTPIVNGGSFTLTISAGQNLWIKFESDAIGSTFNFVQLEEGSVATVFENRPVGLELMLCQRYYEEGNRQRAHPYLRPGGVNVTDSTGFATCYFKVQKRITPTISAVGSFGYVNGIVDAGIYAFTAMVGANNGEGESSVGWWTASAEL